jgi:hypothetical protein
MSLPRRLIHNEYDLQEIAELQDRPIELIERDFALVTVAAHLVDQFPGQLCFKGGFVLRHVRGYARFSGDLDATRTNPPKHKIAAPEVAEAMRRATDEPMLRIDPGVPATDSKHSLDFDQIAFHTPHHEGQIAVEISYREAVVDEPEGVTIGPGPSRIRRATGPHPCLSARGHEVRAGQTGRPATADRSERRGDARDLPADNPWARPRRPILRRRPKAGTRRSPNLAALAPT